MGLNDINSLSNSKWNCKGYYVDTVGKNESRIAEYIKHQLDEDKLGEQLYALNASARSRGYAPCGKPRVRRGVGFLFH